MHHTGWRRRISHSYCKVIINSMYESDHLDSLLILFNLLKLILIVFA